MKRLALVTGASTGIGRAVAERLAQVGWYVLAGCRGDGDAAALNGLLAGSGEAIQLDVTEPAAIRAAVRIAEAHVDEHTQVALVNNAGTVAAGPFEALSAAAWRQQFDVNLFGVVDLTREFLPLLRRQRGRIVNMGSLSGRVAFPGLAPYNASKFALEGLTDTLRMELEARFGIKVILVAPGAVKTPLWDKSEAAAAAAHESYGEDLRQTYADFVDDMKVATASGKKRGNSPEKVAEVVRVALAARRPRSRYLVGSDARIGVFLRAILPDRWLDKMLRAAAS